MIPTLIATLVACLAVIAWQRGSLRVAREMNAAFDERLAECWSRLEADDTLIADAYALLHDEKRRGKALNHAAWLVARSEWCERWRG